MRTRVLVAGEQGAGALSSKFFTLSENFLVRKFSSKSTKFGTGNPPFEEIGSKIQILSTRNILHRKFAAVCWKIVTFCPHLSVSHDAAGEDCWRLCEAPMWSLSLRPEEPTTEAECIERGWISCGKTDTGSLGERYNLTAAFERNPVRFGVSTIFSTNDFHDFPLFYNDTTWLILDRTFCPSVHCLRGNWAYWGFPCKRCVDKHFKTETSITKFTKPCNSVSLNCQPFALTHARRRLRKLTIIDFLIASCGSSSHVINNLFAKQAIIYIKR